MVTNSDGGNLQYSGVGGNGGNGTSVVLQVI